MKPILKNPTPPESLIQYTKNNPRASWEQLRNENPSPYNPIRIQIVQDQFKLCAYCECQIDAEQAMSTRIEHFHPKSDTSNPNINWALLWENMIGVCNGGDNPHLANYLPPLPQNLSCDSHKNHVIQNGKLNENCEGFILNPLEVIAFPILLQINRANGFFEPNEITCQGVTFTNNQFTTTYELINNTIKSLNLNCDRLAQQRLLIIRDIEKNKRSWQKLDRNVNENLLSRYLNFHWRPFFTTIRLCLGQVAEQYLQTIQFRG